MQYTHSPNGLFPAPLFKDNSLFEDTKTLFYSFGCFMGICLRCGITMDLNLNPLFIKYIKEGFPSIVSMDGGMFYNNSFIL